MQTGDLMALHGIDFFGGIRSSGVFRCVGDNRLQTSCMLHHTMQMTLFWLVVVQVHE